MEKLSSSGKYSLKNIPIPTDEKDQEYNKKALSQMEHFLRRMRWRAIYYQKYIEKQNNTNDDIDETFDEDFETTRNSQFGIIKRYELVNIDQKPSSACFMMSLATS